MTDRPNVLVIMTDQERYPTPYEDDAVAAYRRQRLVARERLRADGLELHHHYIASSACVPSRTSLFTGQYPSLHRVRATNGIAKQADDPAMTWLDPDTVPTMGDWFRAAGYRTHYRGKWHLSDPDLPGPAHQGLATNDREGARSAAAVEAYRRANRLGAFGFDGWIGREPHGADPSDTGFVRDGLFADEVAELFAGLSHDEPWLAVASFVNPHDIVFAQGAWSLLGFPDVPDDVPDVPEAPSQSDGFDDRPACHPAFRQAWGEMLYPQPPDGEYRRFYLWLHELVDRAIERVLDALDAHGYSDDTIVVWTSDHGEMLGAHGGLQQKWHNAFEETIRVPFVVRGPGIERRNEGVTTPTSHIDVLPTLLGLVGADTEALEADLCTDHVEVQPLVGCDLSAVLRGERNDAAAPVYFMTEDEVSRGLRTTGIASNKAFRPVGGAASLECIVADVDDAADDEGRDGDTRRWKLVHYYESNPEEHDGGERDDALRWELHDLTNDPAERVNHAVHESATFAALREILAQQRARARRRPTLGSARA